jgi:hypothetical protein
VKAEPMNFQKLEAINLVMKIKFKKGIKERAHELLG